MITCSLFWHIMANQPLNTLLQYILWSIQYNTNSIYSLLPTSSYSRPRAHYIVQFTVQFWSSAVNKNVFSLHLNSGVERNCLRSVGSQFQARAAATEKALFPNVQLVRGTLKSSRLDDRTEGLLGTSATRANRSLRYLGERPSYILWSSEHSWTRSLKWIKGVCITYISDMKTRVKWV